MTINLSKPALKKTPVSITSLYKQGHPIPSALYHYTQQLFRNPAGTKERELARKLEKDLKKYAELHINPKKKDEPSPNYFLLHKNEFEAEDIETFYHDLDSLLKNTSHVVYQLTPQQFAALIPMFEVYVRNANDQLMIYLHGNQTLTGAPIIIGGYPHLDYFQWGNLYGVIKYEEHEGEEVHAANLMIYFESRHSQTLEQCMHNLLLKLQQETPKPQEKITPEPEPSTAPTFGLSITPDSKKTEE